MIDMYTTIVIRQSHYTVVDVSLFPIDTLKTRFQSKNGFWVSGGVKNIYRGLGVVSAGSVPGSAIFFSVYQAVRRHKCQNQRLSTLKDAFAAPALGEIGACLVRVPVEVVKQRYLDQWFFYWK